MPLPRKRQISLQDTPYYHCMSRCVRGAYLCGKDNSTGKSYEHRRQWMEDRLLELASIFCIDVCAYAVMSNHLHVVLRVNQDQALELSDKSVIKLWQKIHKPTGLAQQYIQDNAPDLSEVQQQTVAATIAVYRQRLFDISWFMRELNEPIARQANTEDECKGHFWEGRFKSQALLDEKALAACMVYVDLNPIRANIATTPETSDHTSIKRRINALQKGGQPSNLMPFREATKNGTENTESSTLPLHLIDYIALVNSSAQMPRKSKSDVKRAPQTHSIATLDIDESTWFTLSHSFESTFNVAAGSHQARQQYSINTERKKMVSATCNYT